VAQLNAGSPDVAILPFEADLDGLDHAVLVAVNHGAPMCSGVQRAASIAAIRAVFAPRLM